MMPDDNFQRLIFKQLYRVIIMSDPNDISLIEIIIVLLFWAYQYQYLP